MSSISLKRARHGLQGACLAANQLSSSLGPRNPTERKINSASGPYETAEDLDSAREESHFPELVITSDKKYIK